MSLATLSSIEKNFGKRVLFDKLDLNVERGQRIGLIGANGTGKTTLFKLLTGQATADSGSVAIAKGTKLGHLAQDPVFEHDNTVIDEAEEAFAALHELSHRLRDIEHEMAVHTGAALEKVLRQYQSVQHEFDLAGGYAWRRRLEATLQGVGLDPSTWEQKVQTLSGGQRSRLALARLLISEPDVLLLDEPTNHLDLVAIEWLERYLLSFGGAVVLISHDRYLLDRLATRIVWLTDCRLKDYPGNYSAFVQQRQMQELGQQRAHEQQRADISKQQEFIRRFGAGQRSREAQGRKKRLERLLKSDQLITAVSQQHKIKLSISTDRRAGDQVLTVRELSKSFDTRQLWNNATLDLHRGDRVGIIGANGTGKTTLLRVLLGEEDADQGNVRWGANLRIGYYDQRLDDFDSENTVLEEVSQGRALSEKVLRETLAMMLFRGDDIHKQIGLLSGGERARVRLAELLLDRPNVLLLDEPTNHLDIPSREALENSLTNFDGTLLCVSHDRFFLQRIVRKLLVIQCPQIQHFDGSYAQWAVDQEKRTTNSKPPKTERAAAAAPARAPKARKKDNPYSRPFGKLASGELERQIAQTEAAMGDCQRSLANSGTFKDATRAHTLAADYKALTEKLAALEAEYFAREN